jgi:membrane protease YdiL (CAAX protease family)
LNSSPAGRQKILVYVVITFALSSIFYYLISVNGGIKSRSGLLVLPLMWCPGVAAMGTQLFYTRSLGGLGWRWGMTRYQCYAYFLPLVYTAVAYGILWATGLVPINREFVDKFAETLGSAGLKGISRLQALAIYLGLTIVIGTPINCATALGEELGWRGLLVPELAKITNFRMTALISGLIWSAWHYPLIVFGGYTNEGAPIWYAMMCFTIMVIGISFGFAWLRLKSGSLWTGMFFHASHNLFVQAVFTPLSAKTENSIYLVDEFGAALAFMGLLVAYFFGWRSAEPAAK